MKMSEVPRKPFQIFVNRYGTNERKYEFMSGVPPKFCSLRNIFCLPAKNRNFRVSCNTTEMYGLLQSRVVFHAPIVLVV
jgi:hypothetical protein